jgi:hypothetical protein
MPVVANLNIEGLKELEARLLELDALAGKRLLTRVTRRSLIPLRRAASNNARVQGRSGALGESVRIVTVTPRGTNAVEVQVGPKQKDRKGVALHNVYYTRRRRGIFYGHLVEFGFTTRGRSGRKVAGRPWFNPAWNATRTGIVPEFKRILALGLDRIARRAAQRGTDTERTVDP